jgi:hypothetical protein
MAPERKLPAIIAARKPAAIDTIEINVLLPLIDVGVFVIMFLSFGVPRLSIN